MSTVNTTAVEDLLAKGVRNVWYPICPSSFVAEKPVSFHRVGYRMVLWRDVAGRVHALAQTDDAREGIDDAK